jgi:hypothetical protein
MLIKQAKSRSEDNKMASYLYKGAALQPSSASPAELFGTIMWIAESGGELTIICPNCATAMKETEKNTFTGREMREYECSKCGRKEIIDHGKALWETLSEANEQDKE